MSAERVPFEQMTEDQKKTAFEKWMSSRETRKTTSDKRRKAVRALVAAHQDEYNALLAGNPRRGGQPTA